jgi:hypothetical protein
MSCLWDNLRVVIKDYSTGAPGAVLWSYPAGGGNEDFEAYNSSADLQASWIGMIRPSEDPDRPNNDTPLTFTATDARLFTNTSNPGTQSSGYSSTLTYTDFTTYQGFEKKFPAAIAPGTYEFRLEYDRYVYKDPAQTDPWGLGNKVYILTNAPYDDAIAYVTNGDPDPELAGDGFRATLWAGDAGWVLNGVWDHKVLTGNLVTSTGNITLLLMMNDKHPGASAVAWDNIKFTIYTPCHTPRFDIDGDTDVDQEDFGLFQVCFSGQDLPADFNLCRCMNSDGTNPDSSIDVDQVDYAAFQACGVTSGPFIAANAACEPTTPP